MTLFYFIIALGFLVLAHEWGHFIVARKSGIKVETFSIGFGPRLFWWFWNQGEFRFCHPSFKAFKHSGEVHHIWEKGKYRREVHNLNAVPDFKLLDQGETNYQVSVLPLGGYVKLYGEDPLSEAQGDEDVARQIADSPHAFSAKPWAARLATVMAGPIMNLVLCFLLMPAVFMVGRLMPAILDDKPVILGVRPGSPAEKVGLSKGEVILKFDGREMRTWSDVSNQVLIHPNTEVVLTVAREGVVREVKVDLVTDPEAQQEVGYAGFEPQYFWGNEAIVGSVMPGMPAEKAGLQAKDRVTAVNGEAIENWSQMTEKVRASEGKPLTLDVDRSGAPVKITITPVFKKETNGYVVGLGKFIDPSLLTKKKYAPAEAIRRGFAEGAKLFKITFDVLGRLFTGNLSYKSMGGPVQIAQASGEAAKSGLGEFLYFMSFLSLQLGIMNLLPIPVLDGGHVLFMAIEGIRRKPLSVKIRNTATQIGMISLLSLMAIITFNDLDRLLGFSKLVGKIKGIF